MTVVVSWDTSSSDGSGQVHFEAFQCSDQCTQLHRDGWLLPEHEEPVVSTETGKRLAGGGSKGAALVKAEKEAPPSAPPAVKPTGVSRVRNPQEPDNKQPVIVAGARACLSSLLVLLSLWHAVWRACLLVAARSGVWCAVLCHAM